MQGPTIQRGKLPRRSPEAFRGCLLGGAVGDALGAAVEFMSLNDIRARFGPGGIRDLAPAYGRVGAITDDTQMTLFTAEGLLRADNRRRERGDADRVEALHHSYLRWLETQDGHARYPSPGARKGWLLGVRALHSRRAPGNTCLGALRTEKMGTPERPLNDSKGCGGVMRVAPVGLAVPEDSFLLGCRAAAITHGHPSGYLAAGFFAAVIAAILDGRGLEECILSARKVLASWHGHGECLRAVDSALRMARESPPTPESVEELGAGWVAEEALAIALFCALKAESFQHGVILAANHGGDSDSTASMAGDLLGALLGKSAIPTDWLEGLELQTEIEELAADLWSHFGVAGDEPLPADDPVKYPGW